MKRFFVIIFWVLCLNVNAQTSYIQVVSEPKVSVFLDYEFKGITTTEMGGLMLDV